MKGYFAITVILMIILMSLGCATIPETTTSPTAGKDSLVSTVGSRPFVGEYQRGTLERSGDEMPNPGLYVNLPSWGFHILTRWLPIG